jgi:hypothetical protein
VFFVSDTSNHIVLQFNFLTGQVLPVAGKAGIMGWWQGRAGASGLQGLGVGQRAAHGVQQRSLQGSGGHTSIVAGRAECSRQPARCSLPAHQPSIRYQAGFIHN